MVKHTMVGRMVHGYAANDILTCSKMEQIAQKICVYQKIVVPLHTVFIFELDLCYGRHPTQRLRGVFYCIFG